jgi:hypothetical protein
LPITSPCPRRHTTINIIDPFQGNPLMDGSTCVWTVDELSRYVQDTLCRHENLVAGQFALQSIPLIRLGSRCGLQFLLRGPRSVRLGAVWTAEHNEVYFYNARGERFSKHRLGQSVAFELQVVTQHHQEALS